MSRIGAKGKGESVWLGWFLCAAMDRLAALALRRQVPAASPHEPALDDDAPPPAAEAARWRARAEALRTRLDEVAWDGAWYLRAFHDDGSLVGSAKSRECRIDSIAQSWSVLSRPSGAPPSARARAAVRAAEEQLVREADRLVLLFWPPFDTTSHDPGYVRAYPPGVRENGGQYTHASTWLGFAHASLGDGTGAERIFRLLNPVLRAATPAEAARYRIEPYVLAGDIYSAPPWVGRGGWSWYTGSASWMWRLGVEAILGLRQEEGALAIEPCIPASWPGFEAWVRLGPPPTAPDAHDAHSVHIVVENPDRVASGVAAITLDGSPLPSHRIPHPPAGSGVVTQEVRVRLGAAPPCASLGGT